MTHQTMTTEIVIIGAGLVGLAAAIAMHEAGYQVLLIDRNHPFKHFKKNPDEWDSRIYAISHQNAQWLASLNIWQQLDASRMTAMQGMELWGDQTESPLTLDAEAVQADQLGYIVEADALMHALLAKVEALNMTTLFESNCTNVTTNSTGTQLTIMTADGLTQVNSLLLLAADGHHSWVRTQLNFPEKRKPYAHTAVVANFKVEKPHRAIARQWFQLDEHGALQILAWLPLPNNHISIVWSVPPVFAQRLMALSDDALCQTVAESGATMLGDFTLVTPPASFPLALNVVDSSVMKTVVLLGDAAHQVHPMAGQGVNLGFRDVVGLAKALGEKSAYQMLNDTQLLKQFERARKVDIAKMVLLTDGLYHLFSSRSGIVKKVRHLGFETTKLPYLKALLIKQAVTM
jgi:2-polyprenylphenol 6-hydroxylase